MDCPDATDRFFVFVKPPPPPPPPLPVALPVSSTAMSPLPAFPPPPTKNTLICLYPLGTLNVPLEVNILWPGATTLSDTIFTGDMCYSCWNYGVLRDAKTFLRERKEVAYATNIPILL